MLKNLGSIVQQAKQVKENMAKAEQELTNTYVTGKSASNMVQVTMNCKGDFENIKIDPICLDDKDMLEDLILLALRDVRSQANEKTAVVMREATGGIDLPPGMLPF